MTRLLELSLIIVSAVISAAEGRQQISRDVGGLVHQLQTADVETRRAAARSLAELLTRSHVDSVCNAVDQIANGLSDGDSGVRVGTAGVLAICAAKNPELAVSVLRHQAEIVNNLSSPEPAEREMMLNLLSFLGPNLPPPLETPVLQLLNDPGRKVRKAAMYTLLRFKPVPPQAASSLDSLIEQGDDDRGYAAIILGVIKASDSRTIQALRAGLRDKDRFVRQEAVRALGRIGHPASGAIPEIQALASSPDSDPILRDLSKEAIRAIQ
jgi:HEAT repeat protein